MDEAQVFSNLENIAEQTARAIQAFSNLTWTYCHGDCPGFNSHNNEAGEAVFFDFDDGGPGYLAYYLAVFLWAKISFGRKLTAVWHAFLDGYRAIRPITLDDFEAAVRLVTVRHFLLMGEYASRAQEWGSNCVGWIAQEANFLRTLETEQFNDRLF